MVLNIIFFEKGKNICNENNFYNTLRLLLKYFFLSSRSEVNIMDLIRDVSKTEIEFKVFMVYKNYALDIYYSEVKKLFDSNDEVELNYDDITFYIIYLVKTSYDKDHTVISPYISGMDNDDIIEKFNFIKNTYKIQKDQLEKMSNLQEAITLLENSNVFEKKAKSYRDRALSLLYKIHSKTQVSLNDDKMETGKIKLLF